MTKIDLFSLVTVPLELCANGRTAGNATGFMWKDGQQHYLITNWHVVSGRNASTGEQIVLARPDMIRALFNTNINIFGKKPYDIAIRDQDGAPLWYTHPTRGRGSDVAAVPLPIPGDDPIVNLCPINMLRSEADLAVRIGMDVFILAKPMALSTSALRALLSASRSVTLHRLDAWGAALLGSSAIRTKMASKAKPGVCLAVPVQAAVVGVDVPVTVKSTLSMSNTDGCPCVCRRVVREAENSSPF
jgi:hypothetical protein